ncbi:MAG: hypothetical protein GYB21_07225 [Oceanospirillales bacterium]|nr:hypothetical protein [Oceanospirillales bacterium]
MGKIKVVAIYDNQLSQFNIPRAGFQEYYKSVVKLETGDIVRVETLSQLKYSDELYVEVQLSLLNFKKQYRIYK